METEQAGRVERGTFYWIPATARVGCYKAREKGDAFDDAKYQSGMYFKNPGNALQASRRIAAARKRERDLSRIMADFIVLRQQKRGQSATI